MDTSGNYIQNQFCNYEIALKLKELGFDEECLAYYSKEPVYEDKDGNKTNFLLLSAKNRGELIGHGTCKNSLFQWFKDNDKTYGELYTLSESIAAPLWQQVIDWFREKHDIHIYINPGFDNLGKPEIYQWEMKIRNRVFIKDGDFKSYEEAREQAILKCMELLKNQS